MSIENVLERIAVALEKLEKLVNVPAKQPGPPSPATGSPPGNTPTSGPATVSTGPSPVAAGSPPVDPPITGPAMVAQGAGAPMPTSGSASGVPGQIAPATSPPAPTSQVQGVPTLDDIKALANDFHRTHPDRAHEFVQVLASKNAQKLSELPPASYPEVHGILKRMMGEA